MAQGEGDAVRGPVVSGDAVISLRVSRDGGRSWGPRVTYQPDRAGVPMESVGRFPPCACPKCIVVK